MQPLRATLINRVFNKAGVQCLVMLCATVLRQARELGSGMPIDPLAGQARGATYTICDAAMADATVGSGKRHSHQCSVSQARQWAQLNPLRCGLFESQQAREFGAIARHPSLSAQGTASASTLGSASFFRVVQFLNLLLMRVLGMVASTSQAGSVSTKSSPWYSIRSLSPFLIVVASWSLLLVVVVLVRSMALRS